MTVEFMTGAIILDIVRMIAALVFMFAAYKTVKTYLKEDKTKRDWLGVMVGAFSLIVISIIASPANQPKKAIDVPSKIEYKEEVDITTPEPRFERNEGFTPLGE